jgi:hypothetical protein
VILVKVADTGQNFTDLSHEEKAIEKLIWNKRKKMDD